LVLLLTALGCSLPGHDRGGPQRHGGHAGGPTGASDPSARLTAVSPVPFDPTPLGDAPPTLAPDGGLGSTPGSFAVTANGAATYTVPLALPPGRAGLAPSLALTYDSNAGNGPVGMGFSLTGFSAVTRCGRNLRDDGRVQSVRLTPDDRFCLDGARLVAVNGAYGADGTEYRTVPDAFVKIISHGGVPDPADYTGPLSFTAYAKDGRILEYGTALNATVSTGGVIEKWAVTTVRDRSGNAMTYGYQASASTVDGVTYVWEHYPFDIVYTAHADGTPADRRVAFFFEPNRPDPYESYEHGFKRFLQKRLRRIEVTGPGGEPARRYELAYTNDGAGGRSKLTTLTECAGLACQRPTRFRWAEGRPGFEGAWSTGVPSPPGGMEQLTVMDVDGDGRDDIVYPDDDRWHIVYGGGPERPAGLVKHVVTSAPSNDLQAERWQRGLPFDYDLDGRTDLLLTDASPEWRVLVSTGTDFTLVNTGVPRSPRLFEIVGLPTPGPEGTPGVGVIDHLTVGTFLADLDGDGAKDLIDRQIDSATVDTCWYAPEMCPGAWLFYRNRGAGFDLPVEITPMFGISTAASVVPLDVDGDGKDEILYSCSIYNTHFNHPACPQGVAQPYRFVRWTGAGFEAVDSGLPTQLEDELLTPVDVNGDGLKDLVAGNARGFFAPQHEPTLWLNTGRGFTFSGVAVRGPLGGPGGGRLLVERGNLSLGLPIDYDGDGREDLLVPNGKEPNEAVTNPALTTKFWLLRAQNDHFTIEDPGLPYDHLTFAETGKWYFSNRQGPKALDADGDGQPDLAYISKGTFEWALHHAPMAAYAKADLLTAVYEGSADFDPHPTPSDPAPDPLGTPTHRLFYAPLVSAYGVSVVEGGNEPRDIYRPDAGAEPCVYPCARFVGPRYVVSHHLDDTSAEPGRAQGGVGRFTFYAYDEARVDRHGRGWLGFRARTSKEFFNDELVADGPPGSSSRRERFQRTVYDNVQFDALARAFPFAGRPALQLTYGYEPCDDGSVCRWLSLDDIFRGVQRPAGGATYFAYEQGGVHEDYERVPLGGELWSGALGRDDLFPPGPPPAPVRRTSHTVEVDDYGNPTLVRRRNGPGFAGDSMGVNETVVDTLYPPNEAEWLVAHPTHQTVTDTVAAGHAERQVTVTYASHTGLPRRVVVATLDDPEHFLSVELERDAFGNVTRRSAVDAFGTLRDEAFTYEPDGVFLHAYRNALGHTTRVKAHPLFGMPAVVVDENGLRSTWQYDRFGFLRAETAPDGSGVTHWLTRERQGEAFLLEAHTQSAGGAYTATRFDQRGRPIRQVTRALGGQDLEVTRRYWGFGAPRSESLSAFVDKPSAGATEYDYDAQRRPSLTTLPDGATVAYRYAGLTTFTRNPRGYEGYVTTNARGQVVESAENVADGAARRFRYGPFGALVRSEVGVPSSSAPGEHPTTYVVDAYGRVRETNDPERGHRTLAYNPFGELIAEEDALGRQRFYAHDALGRVTLELVLRAGGSTLTEATTYQYDVGEGKSVGHLVRVSYGDFESGSWHQLVYRRDGLGRVAKLDNTLPDPDTGVAERLRFVFGYDGLGRPSSVTYPSLPGQGSAYQVEYRYDGFDQLRAVVEVGSGLELWAAQEVDQAGRLTSERFGNGVIAHTTYDPRRGHLTSLGTYGPLAQGGFLLQGLRYAYDENGNVTERGQNTLTQQQTEVFGYDALDRLTVGLRENGASLRYEYAYDRLGNLTYQRGVGTYTYEAHRPQVLASAGGHPYGHDAVGNQVERPGGVALDYNAFDLPTRITQNGLERASFAYDGLGQRVRKTTDEGVDTYATDLYERRQRPDGSARHTMRIRAGARPVAELTLEVDPGGAISSAKRYLHLDRLGSPYLVTDEAGAVAERRSYAPFGAARDPDWASDEAPPGPVQTEVGFTGHDDDEGLGLVNMRGRVYDPRLARFLTPDPVVQAPLVSASWHRYSYVWNNPLVFTDPTGFQVRQPEAPYTDEGLLQKLEAYDRSTPGYAPASSGSASGAAPSQQASPAGHRAAATNGPVGPGDEAAGRAHHAALVAEAERGHDLVAGLATMQQATLRVGVGLVGGLAAWELVGGGAVMGLVARAPGAFASVSELVTGTLEGLAGLPGGTLAPAYAGAGAVAAGAAARAEPGVGAELRSLASRLHPLTQALVDAAQRGVAQALRRPAARAPLVHAMRNAHLAGKVHPVTKVPFDAHGFPDFKAAGLVQKEVQITYTGTRGGDFAAANQAAGLPSTPKGMTWHHHQDGTTMQLIPRDIHADTGHTGGFSGSIP
jgi:RHS repeat-associated protein